MKNLATGLVLCLATASASAEVLTFDYVALASKTVYFTDGTETTVQSVRVDGSTINTGDTLRGSFSIDLTTPLTYYHQTDGQVSGSYNTKDAGSPNLIGFSDLQSGYGYAPHTDEFLHLTIYDGVPGLREDAMVMGHGSGPHSIQLVFNQDAGTLFSSTSLDVTRSLVGANGVLSYSYTDYLRNGTVSIVRADLTSVTLRSISPVPEPSAYAMLLLGVATVAAIGRRRRQTARIA